MRPCILVSVALFTCAPAPAASIAQSPCQWFAALQERAIPLYDRPPGANSSSEQCFGQTMEGLGVRNVTIPTLTPFLPKSDSRTSAAVIVVPGGANYRLMIGNEGILLARWLSSRGIAAFVLKYRTVPAPRDEAAFEAELAAMLQHAAASGHIAPIPGEKAAREDVQQALRLVRSRADEWRLDPSRVGLVGFSAGAIAVLNTMVADAPDAVPAFAGLIYGRMTAVAAPDAPPPIFVAVAADDRYFGDQGTGLLDSWRTAGGSAELHLYARGGHGFGMRKQGSTSDRWVDSFHTWLGAHGFLDRRD